MNALDYVNIFEFQISVQVNRGVGNQAQNSYKFLIFSLLLVMATWTYLVVMKDKHRLKSSFQEDVKHCLINCRLADINGKAGIGNQEHW